MRSQTRSPPCLKWKYLFPLWDPICRLYQITHYGPYNLESNSATQAHRALHQNKFKHFLAITASQLSVHGIELEFNCTSTKNSRHELHCIIIIIAPNFLCNHCIIILSRWNLYCIRISMQLVQCMRVHMSLHQNSNLLQTLHHKFLCHYIRIHNPAHILAKSASHIWEHCGIASQFVQFLHGDCIR